MYININIYIQYGVPLSIKYIITLRAFFLQSLVETTDIHIYNEIIRNNKEDTFLKG